MPGNDLVKKDPPPHPVRTRTGAFILIGLAASGWVGFLALAGVLLVGGTDNAQQLAGRRDNAQQRAEPRQPAEPEPASIDTRPPAPGLHPVPKPQGIAILSRFEERRRIQERVREADFSDHQNGNVAAARQVYKHAADRGWAPAALALALTYDPHELRRRGVLVPADAGRARACYRKAHRLMDATVGYYLSRLPAGEGGRC